MSIETSAGPRGKLRAELLGLLQGVVHDELAAADLADDQPIAAQIALDSMDFLDFVIEIRKKLRVWDRSGKRHQFRSDGGSHLEVGYVRVFSALSFEAALSICFLPLLPSFSSPFLFS